MKLALTQHTSQTDPQRDMIRVNYAPYVLGLGHIPVLLPNNLPDIAAYCDALDIRGVVLTGGGDLDPARYGQTNAGSQSIAPERDRTEWALLDLALARGWPVLGICRGFQVLNAYFGGTLVQHIPDVVDTPVPHNSEGLTHTIAITDAHIAEFFGAQAITTNTHHHQGVTRDLLAPGFDVWAVSPKDGIIEGILHRDHPILAVQWHPERPDCPSCEHDQRLFRRFFAEGMFWNGHA